MILVGSANAQVGFTEGMKVLKAGGSAIDAVEATIREVESNPNDHSVGYGGLPNILGEVELDASIIDGRSLESGAVCAVKNYEHVISIARQVMDRLPHVMLAGDGAERFARDTGFVKRDLLTPEAQAIFEGKTQMGASPRHDALRELVLRVAQDAEKASNKDGLHGTVNVIAIDNERNIASGVSTSGWAFKYPGRVGDSPIIGAGNYADNRYGACGCTGYGEMAMRANTAHSVVLYMKMGLPLGRAADKAMKDLRHLTVPFEPGMNLVAVDAKEHHVGLTTETEREVFYVYQTDKMPIPVVKKRKIIPLRKDRAKGIA
jgi:beta-aspartyl-peptidase (threonine type)